MSLENAAKALMDAAGKVLSKTGQLNAKQEPQMHEKEIVEYESRMRVSGLERFNDSCYITVMELYKSQQDLQEKSALGSMILYIKEDRADAIYRALNFRDFEETKDDTMLDACAELANAIFNQFKNEARSLGFAELISSAPLKYKSTVSQGVAFNYDERKYYQVDFYYSDVKDVCLDLTISSAA